MSAFSQIADWPVDNVAAVLLHREDATSGEVTVVDSLGDAARRFSVASVTKPVVAYAVMLAVEEGAVELDQPAGPAGSTLRHLLAHASGVAFDSRELQKPVGQRRIYSSAGYDWAAETVADAVEMSFADYLSEGVLQPLGMTGSALEGSAGHGLVSTAEDLAAFLREVLSPTLLHPDTVREMRTAQFPQLRGIVPGYGMHNPCDWGLGFELRGDKAPHWTGENMPASTAGHFGMSGTYLWVAEDWAMVALTDRDFGAWAKPLWARANDAIWSELG